MRGAVIVSTARTPIGKAYRGAWNNTQAQALGGFALAEAVRRAGLDPAEVEDVVTVCAQQQGSQAPNIARQAALRAGLPTSVPGMTIDRQCASGLMAVATAAKQIMFEGMQVAVGAGVESITLVQNENANLFRARDPWLTAHVPQIYMSMLETAEIVGDRYGISREAQDAYALNSQQRTAQAQAQADGLFDDEIVPSSSRTSAATIRDRCRPIPVACGHRRVRLRRPGLTRGRAMSVIPSDAVGKRTGKCAAVLGSSDVLQ